MKGMMRMKVRATFCMLRGTTYFPIEYTYTELTLAEVEKLASEQLERDIRAKNALLIDKRIEQDIWSRQFVLVDN